MAAGADNQFTRVMVLAASLCLMVAGLAGIMTSASASPEHQQGERIVRLVVDYGDGVEKHFTRLPWEKGMTVLDATLAASDWSRGIEFEHRGKGETAFVTSIEALENEGGRGQRRNWLYYVNGDKADRSAGVHKLAPGDEVRWSFETGLAD